MIGTLIALAAVLLIVWQWSDSVSTKEAACAACRRACKSYGVQFLDETVYVAHMRPGRAPSGTMCWHRVYAFEFSKNGADRHHGNIAMLGRRVKSLYLPVELLEPASAEAGGQVRPSLDAGPPDP